MCGALHQDLKSVRGTSLDSKGICATLNEVELSIRMPVFLETNSRSPGWYDPPSALLEGIIRPG